MPRIRNVKPETFDDPDLGALSLAARWVFLGLWTQADRDGRLEDDPRRLKVRLMPYDAVDFPALLDELAPRFITRYSVNGHNYIQVNNFAKHQRFHKDEKSGTFPAPAGKSSGQPGNFPAKSPESGILNLESGDRKSETIPQPPAGALALDAPAIHAAPMTVDDLLGADPTPDPTAERIAAVSERWERAYAACQRGARSRPNPQRDYAALSELSDTYGDNLDHLEQMFRFFFSADDLPQWALSRSPKCFLKLAPETDAAVRRAG